MKVGFLKRQEKQEEDRLRDKLARKYYGKEYAKLCWLRKEAIDSMINRQDATKVE